MTKNGIELEACGQSLFEISHISKDKASSVPADVRIKILADVSNPLCGPQGATFTFGKQKGLDPSKFKKLMLLLKTSIVKLDLKY